MQVSSSHLGEDNFIVCNKKFHCLQLSDHNFMEFLVDLKRKLALHFYAKAVDRI